MDPSGRSHSQNHRRQEAETLSEIVSFAMEQEQAEHDFYQNLAVRTKNPAVRAMLLEHAEEELAHLGHLRDLITTGQIPESHPERNNPDIAIADYLVPQAGSHREIDYQDALLLAIRMERANQNLYEDLAAQSEDDKVRRIFRFLAEQEAKHRNVLEREYDDNILTED
ncbi:MAG: ferritin family protein [Magnetococcales bacterium]|nr:ferritin family protein [Magnetococcales bacterium]